MTRQGFYPAPGTSGRDGMEEAKALKEEAMQMEYNRSQPATKVMVRRELFSRLADYLSLATTINLLAIGRDTPEFRAEIETTLRRGNTLHTADGSYRVSEAYVDPNWSAATQKETP